MKTSHVFAFLGGALLGGMIALLLAPDKGSETRRKINEKLKEKGINLSREELDTFIEKLKKQLGINREEEIIVEDGDEEAEAEKNKE